MTGPLNSLELLQIVARLRAASHTLLPAVISGAELHGGRPGYGVLFAPPVLDVAQKMLGPHVYLRRWGSGQESGRDANIETGWLELVVPLSGGRVECLAAAEDRNDVVLAALRGDAVVLLQPGWRWIVARAGAFWASYAADTGPGAVTARYGSGGQVAGPGEWDTRVEGKG